MLILIAALGFSIINLPEAVWTWISPSLLWLCALIYIGLNWNAWRKLSKPTTAPSNDVYTLTDDGSLRALMVSGEEVYSPAVNLHKSSLLLPWGLTLNVERTARKWYQPYYEHVRWVLKGECSEADYRRLCRAIIFAQGAGQTRNNINVS
ncbi:hypothetical protein Q4524_04135 [Alteromonas stellipolaris]|uniref:protein YgfX n=1 Tax=Alteromonas stellipolaris TaxID=233316 RepID=UPI0026E275CF|nr:protein YgfX [Alteromonas stellipolaris]MDO6533348.1 hypothetical protein [Alteromonas stellipolaris]MDO6537764.1 hypothetical protein [Alteromonas stellipolaris]MDO6625151.1 hypothetical protein [Alteromonas stellipolaris]